MKNYLQRGMALLCAVAAVPFALAGARLYTATDNAAVKLQWHPTAWAADEAGFVLKRRPVTVDASAPWAAVHAGVLRPSVNYTRDWAQLGFNPAQATALRERVKSQKLDGRQSVSEADMAGLLRQYKQLPAGDGISMMRDATHAYAYGLGYIDNKAKSGTVYEYGLFEVSESGLETPQPVAVSCPLWGEQRTGWTKVTGLEIAPRLASGSVTMKWRMATNQAEAMAVAYFIVERRGEGEKDWILVNGEVPYGLNKTKTEARWSVVDKVTPGYPKPPVRYRLTPVDMFQKKLAAVEYTIDSLVPDPMDSKLFGPASITAKVEKGSLHLEWTQAATKWCDSQLKGFRLREKFAFESKLPIWPATAQQADIAVADLGTGKEFKLEAVYADWDGWETPIESSGDVSLDAPK